MKPLITVIVRSMGRPELRMALASIARQDYPAIEILVVDATGGTHPPLPHIPWPEGHILRKVGGDRRLPRPIACNVGLDALQGEWFCFLDDDDTYDPHHISAMIEAVGQHSDALVVYGQSRMLAPDGQLEKLFGSPFNRALMYYGPLFYWQASLISSKVRDLGCRFDESLDVCEDRDFLNQIAVHGDFVFVPVISFNYRPDLGTSGTGSGSNRDLSRLLYFDGLLRAKWAGPCEYHTTRVSNLVREAISTYVRGDINESRQLLERGLAEYPDDPNALHALARLNYEAGQLAEADAQVRRAIELNPNVAEFRYSQALILEGMGRMQEALLAAQLAGSNPAFRHATEVLIGRLPKADPSLSTETVVARNRPCPCGSGKRYKHCCGVISHGSAKTAHAAQSTASDLLVQHSVKQFRRGEAYTSKGILDTIEPTSLALPKTAMMVAEVYRELGESRREFEFLARAACLSDQPQVGIKLTECVEQLFFDIAWGSLRTEALRLIDRINGRGKASTVKARADEKPIIHLINDFQGIGGSENRAFRLYRLLSPHAEVSLWSQGEPLEHYRILNPGLRVIDPSIGNVPMGGTAIIVGNYFDITTWMQSLATCDRVILCVNVPGLGNMKRIIAMLTLLDGMKAGFTVDFTYPSHMWRERVGLGGKTEYPPVDTRHFTRNSSPPAPETSNLIVGRLSRADRSKLHPDDPHLIRRIVAKGHRFRIMDGSSLNVQLQDEVRSGFVELLSFGAMDSRDFLSHLDCFLYWKHPLWIETGCSVILEAMSVGLPVIMFARDLGVAELIEHGKDGFLVETEEEALECLDILAASPYIRKSVGQAARRKAVNTLERQQAGMLNYYLHMDRLEAIAGE